jgi:hypothetical protein
MGRRPTSGVRFVRFHPRHYCWTGDAEDSGIGRPHGGNLGQDASADTLLDSASTRMRLPTSVNETEVVFAEPFRDPSSRWVSGRNKRALLVSLGVVFFTLLTLYASALGVLLPNQIQNLDPNAPIAIILTPYGGNLIGITRIWSSGGG